VNIREKKIQVEYKTTVFSGCKGYSYKKLKMNSKQLIFIYQ